MGSKIENTIDSLLEKELGGIGSQLNLVFGILLLITGIIIMIVSKKQSRIQEIISLICIGIGSFSIIWHLIYIFLKIRF